MHSTSSATWWQHSGLASKLTSLALAACAATGEPGTEGTASQDTPQDQAPTTGSEVSQTASEVADPHPGGDPVPLDRLGTSNLAPEQPEPEAGVRNRQRMNLDQLDQALLDTTGFRWTEENSDTPMLEVLADTLGKPDYIQSTLEDLTPSLLFHKFLDDAARSVCTKLIAAEVERSPEERIFLRAVDPAAPTADEGATSEALAHALLRFHGRHLQVDAPELDLWRWLLTNTPASEENALLPWTNVCVALITHPDFYAH